MADEEALAVVVGVNEPTRDVVRTVAPDFASLRVEHVHTVQPHLDAVVADRLDLDVRLSEDYEEVPLPVFLSSSPMWRSAFILAFRIGIFPSFPSSEARAS